MADCRTTPHPEVIRDPAASPRHAVSKVSHDYLEVDALVHLAQLHEDEQGYRA